LGAQLNWRHNIDAFISENELDFIEILVNLLANDETRYDLANKLKYSNSAKNNFSDFKRSVLTVLP